MQLRILFCLVLGIAIFFVLYRPKMSNQNKIKSIHTHFRLYKLCRLSGPCHATRAASRLLVQCFRVETSGCG